MFRSFSCNKFFYHVTLGSVHNKCLVNRPNMHVVCSHSNRSLFSLSAGAESALVGNNFLKPPYAPYLCSALLSFIIFFKLSISSGGFSFLCTCFLVCGLSEFIPAFNSTPKKAKKAKPVCWKMLCHAAGTWSVGDYCLEYLAMAYSLFSKNVWVYAFFMKCFPWNYCRNKTNKLIFNLIPKRLGWFLNQLTFLLVTLHSKETPVGILFTSCLKAIIKRRSAN